MYYINSWPFPRPLVAAVISVNISIDSNLAAAYGRVAPYSINILPPIYGLAVRQNNLSMIPRRQYRPIYDADCRIGIGLILNDYTAAILWGLGLQTKGRYTRISCLPSLTDRSAGKLQNFNPFIII